MTDSEDTIHEGASSEHKQSDSSSPVCLSAKIVTVGDSGVGKSSLIQMFSKSTAWLDDGPIGSTIGVDFVSKEVVIDNYCLKLQIWDTAGQERYHALVTPYFRNAVGVVAVYDVTSRLSFQNLKTWLNKLETVNTDPVIIVVGNKIDRERQVTRSEGLQFSKERGALYMETSVLIGHGVSHIFEKLMRKVLQSDTLFNKLQEDTLKAETSDKISIPQFRECLCN
ncbi:ras-related protein Rab-18-B-like [Ischnura elegans]|uniref:ras-related protein Rab-18-B-like n=1 Tax=Ischnura elegans TaxID=197161 RepID=UPI001ED8AEA2|nr:ras-related protein Rab-18-B-like [Ischnura elegans]XP_046396766.1 ras-related protein Rab-18-B-like [Ischnura elegans]